MKYIQVNGIASRRALEAGLWRRYFDFCLTRPQPYMPTPPTGADGITYNPRLRRHTWEQNQMPWLRWHEINPATWLVEVFGDAEALLIDWQTSRPSVSVPNGAALATIAERPNVKESRLQRVRAGAPLRRGPLAPAARLDPGQEPAERARLILGRRVGGVQYALRESHAMADHPLLDYGDLTGLFKAKADELIAAANPPEP